MIIRVRYRRSFCRAGSVVDRAVHEVAAPLACLRGLLPPSRPGFEKPRAHEWRGLRLR